MKRSIRARVLGALTNLLLLVAFAFGAMMLVPTLLGMHHYVILTGSMTGTYDRGSIIFDKAVPTEQLKVGDPITYSPPAGQTAHSEVTHRIHKITKGRDGLRIYQSKGDANIVPDPWKFQLPQKTQDKVVFHVPYAGYGLGVLSDRKLRMYLLGIPAILVALGALRGLFREEREAEQAAPPGWGDIGELVHEPGSGSGLQGETDVADVFVALPGDGRAPSRGRPASKRRAPVARGPRVAHLNVPQTPEVPSPEIHLTERPRDPGARPITA